MSMQRSGPNNKSSVHKQRRAVPRNVAFNELSSSQKLRVDDLLQLRYAQLRGIV